MKRYLLNEDKLPPKLPVVYSDTITSQIEDITNYNKGNISGLSALVEYIDGISKHISNRAIAFGYGSTLTRNTDGMTIMYDRGVCFRLVNDSERTFIIVNWINLTPEDFGLEMPPMLYENKTKKIYRLTETQLHTIIKEVVKEVLLSA